MTHFILHVSFASMTQQTELLAKIEKFLERRKLTPTAFGQKAVGDGNFVSDLRKYTVVAVA